MRGGAFYNAEDRELWDHSWKDWIQLLTQQQVHPYNMQGSVGLCCTEYWMWFYFYRVSTLCSARYKVWQVCTCNCIKSDVLLNQLTMQKRKSEHGWSFKKVSPGLIIELQDCQGFQHSKDSTTGQKKITCSLWRCLQMYANTEHPHNPSLKPCLLISNPNGGQQVRDKNARLLRCQMETK